MEETPTLTTMTAKILRVCCCDLLVCDTCTCQEVLVHTPRACCFSVGECVCIEYSGAMTMSIPPHRLRAKHAVAVLVQRGKGKLENQVALFRKLPVLNIRLPGPAGVRCPGCHIVKTGKA